MSAGGYMVKETLRGAGFRGPLLGIVTPSYVAKGFKEAVDNLSFSAASGILMYTQINEWLQSKIEPSDIVNAARKALEWYKDVSKNEDDLTAARGIFHFSFSNPRFREVLTQELQDEIEQHFNLLPKREAVIIAGVGDNIFERLTDDVIIHYHEKNGITVTQGFRSVERTPIELKKHFDGWNKRFDNAVTWPLIIDHFKSVAKDPKTPEWQSALARQEYLSLGYRDLEAV